MRSKLLALVIGLALIGTAFYLGQATKKPPLAEESEDLAPAHSPILRQKPGLFQKVSFHPSDSSAGTPVSKERNPLDTRAASLHWRSIESLVNCASEDKGCPEDIPETDPSSKFFTLRDRILDELDWFNSHEASAAQAPKVVEAAHMMLAMPDEEIQCRSLDTLLALPPSSKTPGLIARNMVDLVDSDCVQKVVKVLRRSLDDSNVETVTNYACEIILHGAILSSKEMAKSVGELVTASSRSRLEACMAKLPKSERLNSMQQQLYSASAI